MTVENPSPQVLAPDLADAGLLIDKELQRAKVRFSDDAGVALAEAHAEFLADLGIEAVRLTRKDRLATVDRVHVEKAADRLGANTSSSSVASICNTLGGLIEGAGIAATFNIAFGGRTPSIGEIMVTIGLSIVGGVLLAIGLTILWAARQR